VLIKRCQEESDLVCGRHGGYTATGSATTDTMNERIINTAEEGIAYLETNPPSGVAFHLAISDSFTFAGKPRRSMSSDLTWNHTPLQITVLLPASCRLRRFPANFESVFVP
jgi:hypothetical protein